MVSMDCLIAAIAGSFFAVVTAHPSPFESVCGAEDLRAFPKGDDANLPVEISMHFYDMMVDGVDDATMTISMRVKANVTWAEKRLLADKDNATGQVCNLRDVARGNYDIWVPDLYIYNNVKTEITSVHGKDVTLEVDLDTGVVSWWFQMSTDLLCHMDFHNYPFDKHTCHFMVGSISYGSEDQVYFGSMGREKKSRPLQYSLKISQFGGTTGGNGTKEYSVTGMTIDLKRAFLPFILNIYLPTFLLVLISWIGFLVPCDLIPGRMALLVTIFLMLVNISNMARGGSPATTDLTSLDIWLIGCMLFVAWALFEFAVLLRIRFGTAVTCNGSDKKAAAKCKRIDSFCILGTVSMWILFNALYWTELTQYH